MYFRWKSGSKSVIEAEHKDMNNMNIYIFFKYVVRT